MWAENETSKALAVASLCGLSLAATFRAINARTGCRPYWALTACGETEAAAASPAAQGGALDQAGTEGAEEVYVGTMQGVGGRGAVMLAVKAPASTAILPGLLQQSYATDAGPGGAAPPLVGERNRSIILQPLAEEEGRVAAGKTQPESLIISVELTLRSTPA
jgi:hypothetical protein